tara:strand:- start:2646 stop:2783 length:138 start_codon:yes stop_codon:yes gene_type:complete
MTTIFEHLNQIQQQCEHILKLLEEEPLDTWFDENMKKDLKNLNEL